MPSYRNDSYLAEAEPLLIGLAQDAYPSDLLNYSGVPVKETEHQFETISE